MNQGSTSVKYELVEKETENIKDCATTMNNIFYSFIDSMNEIGAKEAFVGEAGDTLNQKFNVLKRSFDDYVALVNNFAASFKGAAQTTSQMDKRLENEAANL